MSDAIETLRSIARSVAVGPTGRIRYVHRAELVAMARAACDAMNLDYSVGVVSSNIPAEGPGASKDSWDKPRNQGQHFTDDEIAQIKIAYQTRRKPNDIARELKCSSRNVAKYYRQFREQGVGQAQERPFNPSRDGRYYKSNFEL